MKIPVIIDGKMVQVDSATPLIQATKLAGVTIPTLCYHSELKPYGACRLCIVEIIQNGRRTLVTSCNYPVETGIEVFTDTARVRRIRTMLVELLLARSPDVPFVRNLAKRMGVETVRLKKRDNKECVLCGLCVRFCDEVVGASAIGLSNRGTEREVSTPFKGVSDTCILCGSCTYICPTGCIEMTPDTDNPKKRKLTIGKLQMEACPNFCRCEDCDTDNGFIKELRDVVGLFRSSLDKKD